MGDRGNVFFVDGGSGKQLEGLYMYTHWSGSFLPAIVRAALTRGQGRWGDPQYLARIVFCEMIADDVLGETGFGLSTRIGDNGHAIIRIDDRRQQVSFHDPGKERVATDKGFARWSYGDYIEAGDQALLAVFAPPADEVELPRATAKAKPKRTPARRAKRTPAKRTLTKRTPVTRAPNKKAKSKRTP